MDNDLAAADFSGVLLTGGTAARMDGTDKSLLEIDGRTLLELCLAAFREADDVVVVGPPVPTHRPVIFAREDPPLGGPAAGLLAGIDALPRSATLIGVLAVDMPQVSPATFARLRYAAQDRDGAFLTDMDGRRQLCGVLSAAALARVRPGPEERSGMAMRALLTDLDLALVPGLGDESRDVDTWADLRDLASDRAADPATRMEADTCTGKPLTRDWRSEPPRLDR